LFFVKEVEKYHKINKKQEIMSFFTYYYLHLFCYKLLNADAFFMGVLKCYISGLQIARNHKKNRASGFSL